MQLRDTLGTIYTDEAFADLFPTHGQPAFAPWRLALVTVFQFMEGLTDRQAALRCGRSAGLEICAQLRTD
jgi:transposase